MSTKSKNTKGNQRVLKRSQTFTRKPRKLGVRDQKRGSTARMGKPPVRNDEINLAAPMEKDNLFLNFGQYTQIFLKDEELGEKRLTASYNHTERKWDITYKYRALEGIVWGAERTLTTDQLVIYVREKNKKKDTSPYVHFVGKLLNRVGVDLSKAKIAGPPKTIENFIVKHLCPLEVCLLNLNESEWNSIDSKTVHEAIVNALIPMDKYYVGLGYLDRKDFLVKSITGTAKGSEVSHPDWKSLGLYTITKSTLLKDYKVDNKMKETDEKKIAGLIADVFKSSSAEVSASSDGRLER